MAELLAQPNGALTRTVAWVTALLLLVPWGANIGMPLAQRLAMWTDLVDFV